MPKLETNQCHQEAGPGEGPQQPAPYSNLNYEEILKRQRGQMSITEAAVFLCSTFHILLHPHKYLIR